MANGQWGHFPHETDMGVKGFGRSKEEAFEQAAVALTAVISDPESVEFFEPLNDLRGGGVYVGPNRTSGNIRHHRHHPDHQRD